MGFLINEQDRSIKGGYTSVVDVTTGKILENVFSSATKGNRGDAESLREYRGIMSGEAMGINGKTLDSKTGVGSMILEHTLETIRDRYQDQEKHLSNVQRYSRGIGKALGLEELTLKELSITAKLHDIGKAFIEPELLNKKNKLTKEEEKELKKHPEIAYWLLKADKRYAHLAKPVLYHHERWDGSGYPEGLKGEEIPLLSRIIAVADAYDAMTTERIYQKKKSREEGLREMIKNSGGQFDPRIVKVFVEKVLFRYGNI